MKNYDPNLSWFSQERRQDDQCLFFDAFGALFDVHSSVRHYSACVGEHADGLSKVWHTKQVEYTYVLTLAGRHQNFEAFTAEALDFAKQRLGINSPELQADLLQTCDCA